MGYFTAGRYRSKLLVGAFITATVLQCLCDISRAAYGRGMNVIEWGLDGMHTAMPPESGEGYHEQALQNSLEASLLQSVDNSSRISVSGTHNPLYQCAMKSLHLVKVGL